MDCECFSDSNISTFPCYYEIHRPRAGCSLHISKDVVKRVCFHMLQTEPVSPAGGVLYLSVGSLGGPGPMALTAYTLNW